MSRSGRCCIVSMALLYSTECFSVAQGEFIHQINGHQSYLKRYDSQEELPKLKRVCRFSRYVGCSVLSLQWKASLKPIWSVDDHETGHTWILNARYARGCPAESASIAMFALSGNHSSLRFRRQHTEWLWTAHLRRRKRRSHLNLILLHK